MKIQKSQGGYSLIEIIIYIAVFAMLSVVVVNSFITTLGSFAATRTNRDLLDSGNNSIGRLSREIRQAKSVDTTNSTLGSSPGVLVLNTTDGSGNARVVKFVVASGALNLYEGTTFAGLAFTGNLIGQNVKVTSLIFRKITTTVGSGVKIEMTLQDQLGKTKKSENFYDTVILRGDY